MSFEFNHGLEISTSQLSQVVYRMKSALDCQVTLVSLDGSSDLKIASYLNLHYQCFKRVNLKAGYKTK